MGLATLISALPVLDQILRWAGVGYLLFLAWESWRDGARPHDAQRQTESASFTSGLITNLLNPKAYLFYVAVLSTFLDPADDSARQAIVLSAIYVLVATAVHASIVTLASLLSPILAHPRVMAVAGKGFAVALALVAVWVAWSTR